MSLLFFINENFAESNNKLETQIKSIYLIIIESTIL